jgi:murein DD-endopeptidase MepM/ murein hydrolase activator NlpD
MPRDHNAPTVPITIPGAAPQTRRASLGASRAPHHRPRPRPAEPNRRLEAAGKPKRLKGRLLSRLRSISVMALVGTMALTYSIPAMAVSPSTPGVGDLADALSPQTLFTSGGAASRVVRDSYAVEKIQEKVPGAYAQVAPTFVNNTSAALQWPFLMGVPISTDFGPRIAPCSGCSTYHEGIDMNPGVNTPIQAIADGVVREVSALDDGGLGVYAVIDHQVDGQTITSVYAHMIEGSLLLSVGETVEVGQQVGNVGNTGQSTGPHLHFEIHVDAKPVDPFAWLTERVPQ